MSEALHQAIVQVPEASWEACGKADSKEIRECADVDFVPGEMSEQKDTQPLRYVAIRIRPRQEEFFADGNREKHFAVLSNLWEWNAERLRLAVIAHNVLTALKRIALPAELLRARPKRLRFLIINTAGRLVQHARKMRLATLEERIALWKEALRLLPVAT